MNESETSAVFLDPAVTDTGWGVVEGSISCLASLETCWGAISCPGTPGGIVFLPFPPRKKGKPEKRMDS